MVNDSCDRAGMCQKRIDVVNLSGFDRYLIADFKAVLIGEIFTDGTFIQTFRTGSLHKIWLTDGIGPGEQGYCLADIILVQTSVKYDDSFRIRDAFHIPKPLQVRFRNTDGGSDFIILEVLRTVEPGCAVH